MTSPCGLLTYSSVRPAFRWAAAALAGLPVLHLVPVDFDRGAALLFVPFILKAFFGKQGPASCGTAAIDRICFAVLMGVAAVSTALSPHWAPSLALIAAWIWTLAIPFAIRRLRPSDEETRLLLLSLAVGAIIGSALVAAKISAGASSFPVYGNARLMGLHLLTGSLATMTLLVLYPGSRGERAFLNALTLALWTGLFWTGGRAPVLGLLVGGLLALWIDAPHSRAARAANLAALAALAFATSFVIPPLGAAAGIQAAWERSSAAASLDSISSGRLDFWAVALRHALQSPWIGHGADAYNFLRPRQDGNQPHNFLLQWFGDFGLVGTVALLLLVSRAWLGGAQTAKNGPSTDFTARCGWIAFSAMLVTGLLDGVFYHAIALLPLAFFFGLQGVRTHEASAIPAGAPHPGRIASALSASALVLAAHQFLYVSLLASVPASPQEPAPRLLRVFPSTTNALWRWLEAWRLADENVALDWSTWAGTHTHTPAIYQAFAGKILITRGDLDGAEAAYRQALESTHHTSRAYFEHILELIAKAKAERTQSLPAEATPSG